MRWRIGVSLSLSALSALGSGCTNLESFDVVGTFEEMLSVGPTPILINGDALYTNDGGGQGYDKNDSTFGSLNDVWKFDVGTGEWTWMGGSDLINQKGIYPDLANDLGDPFPETDFHPGARYGMVPWLHNDGSRDYLYLYGGYGYDSRGHWVT